VQDGLSHPVDILLALVLSLFQIDIGDDFLPPGFLAELVVLLPQAFFLLDILLGSFFIFFLFLGDKLVELLFAFCFPGIFLLLFLALYGKGNTFFYRSSF